MNRTNSVEEEVLLAKLFEKKENFLKFSLIYMHECYQTLLMQITAQLLIIHLKTVNPEKNAKKRKRHSCYMCMKGGFFDSCFKHIHELVLQYNISLANLIEDFTFGSDKPDYAALAARDRLMTERQAISKLKAVVGLTPEEFIYAATLMEDLGCREVIQALKKDEQILHFIRFKKADDEKCLSKSG